MCARSRTSSRDGRNAPRRAREHLQRIKHPESRIGFGREARRRYSASPKLGAMRSCKKNLSKICKPLVEHQTVRVGTRPRQLAECYSGTVGTGASGWDARGERCMAMAAYPMTPVTNQRICVKCQPSIFMTGKPAHVLSITPLEIPPPT